MSRYVDAEWLIKESLPLSQKWVNEVQIMTAPSIDIVRCGECKHWEAPWSDQYDSYGGNCNKTGCGCTADDFCSYGEREGE